MKLFCKHVWTVVKTEPIKLQRLVDNSSIYAGEEQCMREATIQYVDGKELTERCEKCGKEKTSHKAITGQEE